MPAINNINGPKAARPPRFQGPARHIPLYSRMPRRLIRFYNDMITVKDAAFCIDQQRRDLIFLKDILKECKALKIDTRLIEEADVVQCEVHKDSAPRDSGEPYRFHPRATAVNLIREFGIRDVDMICAALLHDVLEEGTLTKEYLAGRFNKDIADLVDGVTKLGKELGEVRGRKNIEKLIAASAEDPRVAILKLADNLHNIRTIAGVEATRGRKKAEEIARETLRVYAPLAYNLAMRRVKIELETAAYDFLDREGMDEIRAMIARKEEVAREGVKYVAQRMVDKIEETIYLMPGRPIKSLEIKIDKRPPSQLYRIRKNRAKKGRPIDEDELLLDLYELKIVVDSGLKRDNPEVKGIIDGLMCAVVYQIVTGMDDPSVPGKHDNAINQPKPNGYRAILDTIDSGLEGYLRLAIMTPEMEKWSERGILSVDYRDAAVAQQLLAMADRIFREEDEIEVGTEEEAVRTFKGVAFPITVRTEAGDRREVPRRSTVLDLAYYLHSKKIGPKAVSARVNSEEVGLEYVLREGDRVVIRTKKEAFPVPETLRLVNTPRAQKRVRQLLRGRPLVDIYLDGYASLEQAARERFMVPEDIFSGLLAVEVFKRAYPQVAHNTKVLREYQREFFPKYRRGGQKLDKDGFDQSRVDSFPFYFTHLIRLGKIDAEGIISRYRELENVLAFCAAEFLALAGRAEHEPPAVMFSHFVSLAQRSEKLLEQKKLLELARKAPRSKPRGRRGKVVVDAVLAISRLIDLIEISRSSPDPERVISRIRVLSAQFEPLVKMSKKGRLTLWEVSISPLATEVFKQVFSLIEHKGRTLEEYAAEFYPGLPGEGQKRDEPALDPDGFDRSRARSLRYYLAHAVGTGAIDARKVISEYAKLQDSIDFIISRIIEVAEKELDPMERGDSFRGLVAKIKSLIGIEAVNSIKSAARSMKLKEGERAAVVSARIISKFAAMSDLLEEELEKKGVTVQTLSELIDMANAARRVLPDRIEVTITGRNRKKLTRDIVNGLSDDLDLDIPEYHAVGEGEGPAVITIKIAPGSNFQRQQIIHVASRFGKVEVKPVELISSDLPPRQQED